MCCFGFAHLIYFALLAHSKAKQTQDSEPINNSVMQHNAARNTDIMLSKAQSHNAMQGKQIKIKVKHSNTNRHTANQRKAEAIEATHTMVKPSEAMQQNTSTNSIGTTGTPRNTNKCKSKANAIKALQIKHNTKQSKLDEDEPGGGQHGNQHPAVSARTAAWTIMVEKSQS